MVHQQTVYNLQNKLISEWEKLESRVIWFWRFRVMILYLIFRIINIINKFHTCLMKRSVSSVIFHFQVVLLTSRQGQEKNWLYLHCYWSRLCHRYVGSRHRLPQHMYIIVSLSSLRSKQLPYWLWLENMRIWCKC